MWDEDAKTGTGGRTANRSVTSLTVGSGIGLIQTVLCRSASSSIAPVLVFIIVTCSFSLEVTIAARQGISETSGIMRVRKTVRGGELDGIRSNFSLWDVHDFERSTCHSICGTHAKAKWPPTVHTASKNLLRMWL